MLSAIFAELLVVAKFGELQRRFCSFRGSRESSQFFMKARNE